MRQLREPYGMQFGLRATGWMIEIGTWLMRTQSELVLKSRRVVPGRLLETGFEFLFPIWPVAAWDLPGTRGESRVSACCVILVLSRNICHAKTEDP